MEAVLGPIRSGLASVGLGTPLYRAIALGGGVAALALGLKPGMWFDSAGVGYQWKLMQKDDATAVYVPWYVAAGGAAVVGYVFM